MPAGCEQSPHLRRVLVAGDDPRAVAQTVPEPRAQDVRIEREVRGGQVERARVADGVLVPSTRAHARRDLLGRQYGRLYRLLRRAGRLHRLPPLDRPAVLGVGDDLRAVREADAVARAPVEDGRHG
jgi:hypothetical protein